MDIVGVLFMLKALKGKRAKKAQATPVYSERTVTRTPCRHCGGWFGVGESFHNIGCPLETRRNRK